MKIIKKEKVKKKKKNKKIKKNKSYAYKDKFIDIVSNIFKLN